MTHESENRGDEAAASEHALQLTAWDVPTAIVTGEHFMFSVGVRCPAGCNLGGRGLSLFDSEGSRISTVQLGREIFPGTEALYFAEVKARAPSTAGSHPCELKLIDTEAEPLHVANPLPLVVRVVSAPDCEVTVKALDRERQTPIQGALVVMHPYRAVTDENGLAKLGVTRGKYDILVSVSGYLPVATSVEVAADMTTQADLEAQEAWASPEEAYE